MRCDRRRCRRPCHRPRLAQAGREVIVLEAAEGIGTETSSRNSEVIHAGIYYPGGQPDGADLRRRQAPALCLLRRARRAASQLRQADRRDHGRGGREAATIQGRAEANGVEVHTPLGRRRGMALEPDLNCDGRAALARHRHHRQPRLHAGAARRRRGCAAPFAFHTPLQRRRRAAGRHRARRRRRRADEPRAAGCSSTPPGSHAPTSRQHRRHADRPRPAGLSRQRKLFQLQPAARRSRA